VSDMNTLAPISSDITTVAGKASFITADFVSDLNTLAVTDVVNDINLLATSDIVADLNTLATSDIVSDLNTLATTDIVSDINLLATSDVISDLNQLATSDFVADLNLMATSQNISDLNAVGGSIANVNAVATNLSSVNNFADTYFVGATAPSSPTEGDLWFDTTNDIMKVYDGSGFVNAGSSVNGTSERQTYTATSGQTNFAATYDTGYVDVYLNGVKLIDGTDFTATDGSNVVLTSGAAADDSVDIVAYGTFNILNLDISSDTTPQLGGNLDTNGNDITFGDNDKAIFGAGNDLQIFHSGSASQILDNGTGALNIRSSQLNIRNVGNTEDQAVFTQNAGVELYYDNAKKFETTSTGVDVTGTVTADGLTVDTNTLHVDATNNRVGVNTASPAVALEIDGTSGEMLRLSSTNINQASIVARASDDTNRWKIGTLASNPNLFIEASNASGDMIFRTGGENERMRILDGGGLTFNGDTATTNALDDYEEGQWTPGISTGTINAGFAYYTKIGNLVTVNLNISTISDRTSTNVFTITGLPYTSSSNNRAIGAVMHRYIDDAGEDVTAWVDINVSSLKFYLSQQSNNWAQLRHVDFMSASAEIYMTVTYQAA